MVASQKLTRDEVEQVLRRAAQIETARNVADNDADDRAGRLDALEVVRLGVEAGLSRDAIARALSERDSGRSPVDGDEGRIDPRRVRVTRDLPIAPDKVERALEKFMRDQLMVVRRHHGDRIEWEKARGLFPGLNRSLDFARVYCFGPAERIETRVVAADDGSAEAGADLAGSAAPEPAAATRVTFLIDLSDVRRGQLSGSIMRVVLWLGVGALFARMLGGGLASVVAGAVAAASAAGVVIAARRRFRALRERVALGPDRFMDLLVQKSRKALAPVPRPADDGAENDPGDGVA